MDGIDVAVREPILGGLLGSRTRHSIKGAWVIGDYGHRYRYGETRPELIYLLSDGQICYSGDGIAHTVEEDVHAHWYLLTSVQKLRQKMEASIT